MAEIIINSPKHGVFTVLLDDEDFEYINQFAWHIKKAKAGNFYVRGRINGKNVSMHRIIMKVTDPEKMIDHRNRIGWDNRKSNLRDSTYQQNNCNKGPEQTEGRTSKFKGVSLEAGFSKNRYGKLYPFTRWRVQLRVNGENINFPRFKTELEAAVAYNESVIKHHGDFAYLNIFTEEELKIIESKKTNLK